MRDRPRSTPRCLSHRLPAALLLLAAVPAEAGRNSSPLSALEAARELTAPVPVGVRRGEYEGDEWWDEHESLLRRAWVELGPGLPSLYGAGPHWNERYLHAEFVAAASAARGATADEAPARALFDLAAPGVFSTRRLFTPALAAELLGELQHIESSGIPRRRPNGMNRYGVILDQVGLDTAMRGLVDAALRPLAGMLFPDVVGPTDLEEHHAFTVKYETGGDTELAKHGDASVVTFNLCLGEVGHRGGALRFLADSTPGVGQAPSPLSAGGGSGDVAFDTGLLLVHKGQHKHQALPLSGGRRVNLVVWLMGRGGYVRVAPYPAADRLTAHQRWQPPARDAQAAPGGLGIGRAEL